MKKLSPTEFNDLPLKGKGRSSALYNSIVNLKVGEALLIEKKDWKRKAGPGTLVRYIEKTQRMRFSCGAIDDDKGWAVKRLEDPAATAAKTEAAKVEETIANDKRQALKNDILIFYVGRMGFHKIERIEETVKAIRNYFWKEDHVLLKDLFSEIIKTLAEQGHIVIENEKTYIPLRRS